MNPALDLLKLVARHLYAEAEINPEDATAYNVFMDAADALMDVVDYLQDDD